MSVEVSALLFLSRSNIVFNKSEIPAIAVFVQTILQATLLSANALSIFIPGYFIWSMQCTCLGATKYLQGLFNVTFMGQFKGKSTSTFAGLEMTDCNRRLFLTQKQTSLPHLSLISPSPLLKLRESYDSFL